MLAEMCDAEGGEHLLPNYPLDRQPSVEQEEQTHLQFRDCRIPRLLDFRPGYD
jgi:hypothetical protein